MPKKKKKHKKDKSINWKQILIESVIALLVATIIAIVERLIQNM